MIAVAARWIDPASRREGLKPYGADAEARAVELLQESLLGAQRAAIPDPVQKRLLAAVASDMRDLQPHLLERADALGRRAAERLAARGESEAKAMVQILESQRRRIEETLGRYAQLRLDFDDEGRRQIDADHRHWQRRLEALPGEIRDEPERIRRSYDVRATRVEPVGLVYLWPISG